jgi:midasin
MLSRYDQARLAVSANLSSLASQQPEVTHLCEPVASLARSLAVTTPINSDIATPGQIWQQSDDLISAVLVVAQRLKSGETATLVDEDERVHIPGDFKKQREAIASLRMENVLTRVQAFTSTLVSESTASSDSPACLNRVLPFLEALTNTYAQSIAQQAFTVKSTFKLTYVVARLMLDIAQKGFCKPQEEGDESKGGQDGEMVDGTGLGSGTGDKNVSNEIEEEGQVEGLRGEKEEEKDGEEENEEENDAVSMDDDFEGDLGEGKEKENEGDDGDESEEEDHDEHVGDVDPLDPGAVDEKFWGDEEKEKDEKEKKDGGDEVMDQQQEEGGEAEMTAKEDEKKGKDDKKEEKKGEEPESAADDQGKEGEKGEDEGEGDEEIEEDGDEDGKEGQQPAGQDQTEVPVPEGDKLDLPEDINLDDEAGDDEGPDMQDDMSIHDDREGDVAEEDGNGEDAEMASDDGGEAAEDEEGPAPTGVGEEETNEAEEVVGQERDLSASNDQMAQESAEFGKGGGGGEDGKDKEEKEEKAENGVDDMDQDQGEDEAETKGKG